MIHVHVAQGKNINNAVVSSGEYCVCEDFVHVKNTQNGYLSTFCPRKFKIVDKNA